MGLRERRRKQLLDDRMEKKGYWKWNRKYYVDHCRELALERAMDLS
jgi:hypothetical protein